ERHGSAGIFVGGVDLPLGEADLGQEVKIKLVDALSRQLERPSEEGLAEGPFVEGKFDVEGGRHRLLYRCDLVGGEAARGERPVIDAWSAGEGAAADGIVDDALDLSLVIAERGEALGHHAVDDLEIAAARELLEFDQREVRLDAGGIAVHD